MTEKQADPVAALAHAIGQQPQYGPPLALCIADSLAEQGYVLVNEKRLRDAMAKIATGEVGEGDLILGPEHAAAILAAIQEPDADTRKDSDQSGLRRSQGRPR